MNLDPSDSKALGSFPNIPLFLCHEKMKRRKRDPRPGNSQAMKTLQPGRVWSAEGCRDGVRFLNPNGSLGPHSIPNRAQESYGMEAGRGSRAWAGSKERNNSPILRFWGPVWGN